MRILIALSMDVGYRIDEEILEIYTQHSGEIVKSGHPNRDTCL